MLGPQDLVLCAPPVLHVPLFDRLAPARAAGFTGVSLLPGDIDGLKSQGWDRPDIARRIADEGLAVAEVDCIGWWLPSHRGLPSADSMAALVRALTPERVVPMAAAIGARSISVVEVCGISFSLDEGAEAFARICDLARDHGLLVHLEFVPFGGIPDLAAAWRLVEAAGRANGGLTIDSWHLFRSGSTLEQLGHIPGERIFSVQINDAPETPQPDLLEETITRRLLPNEGSFDLTGLVRTLDRIGSIAPIGVEVFSTALAGMPMEVLAAKWASAARLVIDRARGNSEHG